MSCAEDIDRPIRRREQRVCDGCRRSRRRDGVRMPLKPCSSCIKVGIQCQFTGLVLKRRSYVRTLEARLQHAEQLLFKLAPEAPIDNSDGASAYTPSKTSEFISGPGVQLAALSIRSMNVPAPAPNPDDHALHALVMSLHALSLSYHRDHFHGKASHAILVQAAISQRENYEQKNIQWASRRMRYWSFNPLADRVLHVGPFSFPPEDLLASLVDLYFLNKHIYLPFLHRPTFERAIAAGIHLRERSFCSIVLLVCAIGARFSDDPRVCPPGTEPLRCGYQFFHQLPLGVEHHLFGRPTLCHIQFYCLAAMFLETSSPATCVSLVGIGIRIAQDVGVHRRPTSTKNFNTHYANVGICLNSELWKRAFWVLVCSDRQLAVATGRPSIIRFEDFDAELPIECDDEYLDETANASAFVQPAGKPSVVAFFNCYIRLNWILGFALDILYSLDKKKRLLSYGDVEWESRIVAELDSALNAWVEAIPEHLRWDPRRPAGVFFDQSASLYASYHSIQINIHRLFVPSMCIGAPTAFRIPSLAICTNAARACIHIVDVLHRRKGGVPVPGICPAAFSSAMFLILNVWSGQRTGLPPHLNSSMAEVHKSMEFLRVCEARWPGPGLFWDLLYELSSIGELPLPPTPATAGPAATTTSSNVRKRPRDTASPPRPPKKRAQSAAVVHTPSRPSGDEFSVLVSSLSSNIDYGPEKDTLPDSELPPEADSTGSTSSWYPSQTSNAPLGVPAFVVNSVADPEGTGDVFWEDVERMAMWMNAPLGVEVDEWSAFFNMMSQLQRDGDSRDAPS